MNPLNSVKGTITAGFVLAILILLAIGDNHIPAPMPYNAIVIWLHVFAGIIWIGLLYYFNFVQVPALADAIADEGGPGGAGITKYVAPRALFWFRWGAVFTWLTGAIFLMNRELLGDTFMLGMADEPMNVYAMTIGIGAWLGTIMLFNVWVLIWPNQKKVLGLVQATDEEKNKARRTALLASRTNTMLSIPMLLFMGASAHGLPF